MRVRRILLPLAAAASAGAAALWRRRREARVRVDLYFADGSKISLSEGSPDGDRLVALAGAALAAGRGA